MPPAFNLSQDQTLEFNLCWIITKMIRRTHLELKRNVISSSFQTWAPSFFVLSFLEIPKNFLVILKSKPDTHAYRFVDQLLKNICCRRFATTGLSILRRFFFLSRAFWKIFHSALKLSLRLRASLSTRLRILNESKHFVKYFFRIFCIIVPLQVFNLLFRFVQVWKKLLF